MWTLLDLQEPIRESVNNNDNKNLYFIKTRVFHDRKTHNMFLEYNYCIYAQNPEQAIRKLVLVKRYPHETVCFFEETYHEHQLNVSKSLTGTSIVYTPLPKLDMSTPRQLFKELYENTLNSIRHLHLLIEYIHDKQTMELELISFDLNDKDLNNKEIYEILYKIRESLLRVQNITNELCAVDPNYMQRFYECINSI